MNKAILKKQRRADRIRGKIKGTTERLRLSVDRSNKSMYVQVIDDAQGKTVFGMSIKGLDKAIGTKTEQARELGVVFAQAAKKHKISKVVFDKGLYKYHGRVKAFAEGAREGGLEF